jgi:hypothetical protein
MITQAILVAGSAAVVFAPMAHGAQAYMDGVLNIGPGWSSITGPNGEQCRTGCTEIKYNYFTQTSATNAALKWMDANNTEDAVLHVYSLGSVGAVSARVLRPEWKGTIVAYGSPAKPNNGASYAQGGRPVLDVSTGGEVVFVSVQGDSVAYRKGSLSTHLNGYRKRDFSAETPVKVTEPGEVVDDYEYPTKPAPAPTVTTELSWSEKVAQSKAERAERAAVRKAEAAERKAERAERAAESKAKWKAFFESLKGDDPAEEVSTDDAEVVSHESDVRADEPAE